MAKQVIYSAKAPEPIGPYSQAIKAGNTLYVSGQIPFDNETNTMVTSDITAQTLQVMQNLDAVLQAGGMTFSNVVKCSIFLKDMNDFPEVNEAYGQSFGENPPARETVEVSRLPKDVHVEISCIAVA